MKKKTKLGIASLGLLLGTLALTSCTQSFCSLNDKAHMMYMYDYGVSEYYTENNAEGTRTQLTEIPNLFVEVNRPTSADSAIGNTDANSVKNGYILPTDKFLVELDTVVLKHAIVAYYNDANQTSVINFSDIPTEFVSSVSSLPEGVDPAGLSSDKVYVQDILDKFGYLKFSDTNSEKGNKLFYNYTTYVEETRGLVSTGALTVDDLPSSEWVKLHETTLKNKITSYRSCLAITTDKYGYYGYGSTRDKTVIEAKSWGYAWKVGIFEGLLTYPIGWCIESLSKAFSGIKMSGVPQLLAILIVTIVVRSLLLLATFKQSQSNAKMTALQPELTKIQNKYPNANTNQYEKQRMSEEMSKLYKKNKINPLSMLITLPIQFIVFACVWGAFQGAASLSSDQFLGLYLSMPIKDALFTASMWKTGGAVTALVLFLILSVLQILQMLLPQWLQKRAAKGTAKLGKNPAKKSTDNKMKYFTIIMTVMILIMSFTIASAMAFYWLVGAIFQIVQTLITTKIAEKKKQQKR